MKFSHILRTSFFSLLMGLAFTLPVSAQDEHSEIVKIREPIHIQKGDKADAVFSLMGSVLVDGTINETVVSIMGDITVGPKGKVDGDAISFGGRVIRKPGSVVAGKEISLGLPLKNLEKLFFLAIPMAASVAAVVVGMTALLSSFGFVALIILVLILFEKNVIKAQKTLVSHPLRSSIYGILGFCFLIPVLIFLTVTIIGIPLAFLGAAVAVAALVLGSVSVAYWVGAELSKKLGWKLKILWNGLLGTAILFVVSLIPFIGSLALFCVLFLGLGSVIQTRFRE